MDFRREREKHRASLEGALQHANLSFQESKERVLQNLVLIETMQEHDEPIYGTGLLITENGYIATVNHNMVDPEHYKHIGEALKRGEVPQHALVRDPETGEKTFKYRVRMQDGSIHPLTPWMSTHDAQHDAALLKAAIKGPAKAIPFNIMKRTLTRGAPVEYAGLTQERIVRQEGIVLDSSVNYTSEHLGTIEDATQTNFEARPGWSGGVMLYNGAVAGFLSEGGISRAQTPEAYLTKTDKLQALIDHHLAA